MENYFRDALNNFIFEEAGGGAIRHLANRGYPAKQITESLSFPIPYEKVREAFTKHLLESGILLREEPGTGVIQEKTEFVREYDKYGKASFRKVTVLSQTGATDKSGEKEKWEKMDFEKFFLSYRNGAVKLKLPAETELAEAKRNIYIACDFGADQKGEMLQALDTEEREYIEGICWTKKTMYHLLDRRMFEIAEKLWKMEKKISVGKVYIFGLFPFF